MCINHDPSGSNDGTDDNLQSWNYDAHAVYLATIAEYAAANWGITFNPVEAFKRAKLKLVEWPDGGSGGLPFRC